MNEDPRDIHPASALGALMGALTGFAVALVSGESHAYCLGAATVGFVVGYFAMPALILIGLIAVSYLVHAVFNMFI
ncbi:MAG: hypothetical protein KDB23_02455 [Planctomycetales bacterium]|nr:hypothetical protein [Planctomycetales bacterium]